MEEEAQNITIEIEETLTENVDHAISVGEEVSVVQGPIDETAEMEDLSEDVVKCATDETKEDILNFDSVYTVAAEEEFSEINPVKQETIEEPIPVEKEPEPVVEPIIEEPVVEPIVEESVVEPIIEEPVEEPMVEPIVEPIIEEPVVEPIIEEPIVEPVVEPVVEQTIVDVPQETPVEKEIPPKFIIIVPYRDREHHLKFFRQHMKNVLEDIPKEDYKILVMHQKDTRDFNRGAMKNIGYLVVKKMYPDTYKTITLVFHDVDIIPMDKGLIDYVTVPGMIKHHYGFVYALGGIVSITAGDFEKLNGFPNYWAWGYEDNALQQRVLQAGMKIDRRVFYHIMDKRFFLLHDDLVRMVNKGEFNRYMDKTPEGHMSISNLEYALNVVTDMVDVTNFKTSSEPNNALNEKHDLRLGPIPFKTQPPRRGGRMKMIM